MSETKPHEDSTFHLGLTMAGAVSAGCYTAGVIDYLFEILDLWEKAKIANPDPDRNTLIPKHNVVIEAMGGTSAGGMTTMMTGLYALGNNINPVKHPLNNPYESKNILYDSWVHLDDLENGKEKQIKSFASLWENSDIPTSSSKLHSLFNSTAIDNIADKAYAYYPANNLKEQVTKLPSYISKNLEVLLSHTVLRGIPLEVDFSTFKPKEDKEVPTHTSYEHALITHYRLNNGDPVDTSKYFWFNPFDLEEMPKMKLSTIATGAFPVGLKYRTFPKGHFSFEYMKSILKRSIFADFGEDLDLDNKVIFKSLPKDYETNTVDGGAVNNEPYGEVLSIVRRCAKQEDDPNTNFKPINYGVVMIDPFPDMVDSEKKFKLENDLPEVLPSTFKILREQSKLKRNEMITHLSHNYVKGQIYPKRHHYDGNGNYVKSEKYPIASGSFEAFGGFLDIEFRVYDYFLGRDNARNFFRYYFSMPANNPLFANWTPTQKQFFGFDMDGELFLPIIPDLNLLTIHKLEGVLTPEQVTFIKQNESGFSGVQKQVYTINERPKYDPRELFDLEPTIKSRFKRILSIINERDKHSDQEVEENCPNADAWIRSHFKPNPFAKLGKRFFNALIFSGIVKSFVSKRITESVIRMIVKDLDSKNLLKQKQ